MLLTKPPSALLGTTINSGRWAGCGAMSAATDKRRTKISAEGDARIVFRELFVPVNSLATQCASSVPANLSRLAGGTGLQL